MIPLGPGSSYTFGWRVKSSSGVKERRWERGWKSSRKTISRLRVKATAPSGHLAAWLIQFLHSRHEQYIVMIRKWLKFEGACEMRDTKEAFLFSNVHSEAGREMSMAQTPWCLAA